MYIYHKSNSNNMSCYNNLQVLYCIGSLNDDTVTMPVSQFCEIIAGKQLKRLKANKLMFSCAHYHL